jgi:hypothetical protein
MLIVLSSCGEETASLSEAVAQSKDPYNLCESRAHGEPIAQANSYPDDSS